MKPRREVGGAERDRTDDLLNANQALSQLSYSPTLETSGPPGHSESVSRRGCMADGSAMKRGRPLYFRLAASPLNTPHATFNVMVNVMVGLGRFELPTSRLSGVRSNQLSYRPRQLSGRQSTRHVRPTSLPLLDFAMKRARYAYARTAEVHSKLNRKKGRDSFATSADITFATSLPRRTVTP